MVRIWEEVLAVRPVGIKDNFFDLGGHSLLGIYLFARIEQQFGKKLPVAVLFQSPTVEGLAEAIRGVESPLDWSTLVPIQAEGSRPPFFCVHGFGGGVLGYAELARLMGPEQPFYGLQAQGLNGRETPEARIEDMATHYVRAMRSLQPAGPYYLGGYCYGGVVAFEMARQIRAQGARVALLAIIEGYVPRRAAEVEKLWHPGVAARFLLNLPLWLRDVLRRPGGMARLLARLPLGRWTGRGGGDWDADLTLVAGQYVGDDMAIPESQHKLIAVHLLAIRGYLPGIYPGRVTLFRVQALSLRRSHDPELGWGNLAMGGVEMKRIAGAHYSALQKPYVASLAAKLMESLTQAQSRSGTETWFSKTRLILEISPVGDGGRNGQVLAARLAETKVTGDNRVDPMGRKVVVNHEGQYSIWPDYLDIPLGWCAEGTTGTKGECLAHIGQMWKDMRPLSLRKKMDTGEP